MTDELKEENKDTKQDSKLEKDTERVDKEYLSKAKDSRDMIDKKLRTFENSIEDISDTIKNGETVDEQKEKEVKKVEEIDEEIKEQQEKLQQSLSQSTQKTAL